MFLISWPPPGPVTNGWWLAWSQPETPGQHLMTPALALGLSRPQPPTINPVPGRGACAVTTLAHSSAQTWGVGDLQWRHGAEIGFGQCPAVSRVLILVSAGEAVTDIRHHLLCTASLVVFMPRLKYAWNKWHGMWNTFNLVENINWTETCNNSKLPTESLDFKAMPP